MTAADGGPLVISGPPNGGLSDGLVKTPLVASPHIRLLR